MEIEDGDIIVMFEDYSLPDNYQHRLSLKKGEKYTLRKNFKAEVEYGKKDWWVVSGKYFNNDENKFQNSALTFTKKEIIDIINISKKVDKEKF